MKVPLLILATILAVLGDVFWFLVLFSILSIINAPTWMWVLLWLYPLIAIMGKICLQLSKHWDKE